MPRNGSGTFNRIYSWQTDAANNIRIRADRMDAEMDGMATALTNSVAKDGQTPITGNQPMSSFRHTGVGNASARTDYAAAGQVQDGALQWGGTDTGAADAYEISVTPAITAYAAGQTFRFVVGAGNTNTGAATLAVNGLTTKAIKDHLGNDPVAGALTAAGAYTVTYDGTDFILNSGLTPANLAGNGGTIPETDRTNTFTAQQEIERNGGASHGFELIVSDDVNAALMTVKDSGGNTVDRLLAVDMDGVGAGHFQIEGALEVGNPTGSGKGAGTINAQEIYENDIRVVTNSLASQGQAEAGTANDVLMTPLRTQQNFDANEQQVGVGQTWQDVSGSRTGSTSYQNTTGRPMQISITCTSGTNREIQVSDDNATWVQVGLTSSTTSTTFNIIIPDNWYYRINGTVTLNVWAELR